MEPPYSSGTVYMLRSLGICKKAAPSKVPIRITCVLLVSNYLLLFTFKTNDRDNNEELSEEQLGELAFNAAKNESLLYLNQKTFQSQGLELTDDDKNIIADGVGKVVCQKIEGKDIKFFDDPKK